MGCRETVLYDLAQYGLSGRNGSYLGNSEPKEGIQINGQNWIVKYSKHAKGTNHVVLSEYIGSRVYALLGYDTQEVILGMRNGRLVAACRDFCEDGIQLRTMCALKNRYDKKLEEKINREAHMPAVKGKTDLKETQIHLEYNPVLKKMDGLEKRFWESIVVDCLLCNGSRDDSDWGLLYRDRCQKRRFFLLYGWQAAYAP